MAFPRLTSPVTIDGVTLPSRVVMGSIHTGMEDRLRHVPELAAYFAERARGGVGLIVTGGYSPDVRGWLLPFGSQMTRRTARRHREVMDAVAAGPRRPADSALLHIGTARRGLRPRSPLFSPVVHPAR